MIKKTWKKALAGLCAAAMVMTSISWPAMSVNAEEYSVIPVDKTAVVADSYSTSGEGTNGHIDKAFDGDVNSYWHTNYGTGFGGRVTASGSENGVATLTSNNTVTIPLDSRYTVSSVAITPRNHVDNNNNPIKTNGLIVEFKLAFYNGNILIKESPLYEIDNHKKAVQNGETLDLSAKEFTFDAPVENVTKIVLTVTKAYNAFITAGEIAFKGVVAMPSVSKVDDAVLIKNAKANSEQWPAAWTNDGKAEWAFDDEEHWWHSRYEQTPGEGEVQSGLVSKDNPIWIQTGFDKAIYLDKITYVGRPNGYGRIADYWVEVANLENPTDVPNDADFNKVVEGHFENDGNEKTIELGGVQATHVRIVTTSVYGNGGKNLVTAKRIKVYELTPFGKLGKIISEVNHKLQDSTTVDPKEEVNGLVEAATIIFNNPASTDEQFLEQIKILEGIEYSTYRIDDAVLISNAKANSEQLPVANTNDGGAAWAFDDGNHWWHTRYEGNVTEGEVSNGKATPENPLWIQTGFGEAKYLDKITYANRGNQGAISTYAIAVANLSNPTADPTDADFKIVKAGTFNSPGADIAQTVVLDGVKATHIRLIAYGVHANNYPVAKRIKIWEKNPNYFTENEPTAVESITLDQSGTVNLSTIDASAKAKSVTVTANVTPANASDTRVVWETTNKDVATITALNNNVMVANGTDGTVTSVASNVVVNAVGAGTATITAKSVSNNEVVAKFDVNVTGYIHNNVEVEVGETLELTGLSNAPVVSEDSTITVDIASEIVNPVYTHTIAAAANSLTSFNTSVSDEITLRDAEIILTSTETENVYIAQQNKEDGKFLTKTSNPFFELQNNASTSGNQLKIAPIDDGTGRFELCRASDSIRFTIFYASHMSFNTNGNNNNADYYHLTLLEKQDVISDTDDIPGYKIVSEITSGKVYLIAWVWPETVNGVVRNRYIVLHAKTPTVATGTQDGNNKACMEQTVLVADSVLEYSVSVDTKQAGAATVTVADEVYNITVVGPADYAAVEEAISAANALDKDNYVDFSGVKAAIDAVVRGKNSKEQAEVDAMAAAINDAVAALKLKPEYSAKFTKATASLKGTIGLNFYVQVNDSSELENLSVEFTRQKANAETPEVKTVWLKALEAEAEGEYVGQYKVTFNVAAKEMTDVVTAVLMNGKTPIKTVSTSVRDYAETLKTRSSDAELKKLLDAMLCYGAAAQKEFGYNTGSLAVSEEYLAKALANVTDVKVNGKAKVTKGIPEKFVDLSKVSLLLKDNTVLRVYLTAGEGVNLSTDYVMSADVADASNFNVQENYMEITNISAKDLDKMQTFTITQNNVAEDETPAVTTVVYSPLHYAKAIVDGGSTDTDLVNVAKALYNYHVCAKAYLVK